MKSYIFNDPFLVQVTGKDSIRYLNSRLTNDIKNLSIGSATVAAALTPQGKTQGLFTVLRVQDESFLLYADNGDKTKLLSVVRQYIVADRVDVKDISGSYRILHTNEQSANGILYEFKINRFRGFNGYIDLLIPNENSFSIDNHLSDNEMLLRRILSHIPSYPEEMNEDLLFSEARYSDSFAINKGCYVGQEVVEKIDTVGKTPKILRTIIFDGIVSCGDEIKDSSGSTLGGVLSVAINEENKTVCFARLKNEKSAVDTKILCGTVEGIITW